MAQLRPNEVCRKIKAKNIFKNSNSDFKIEPAGPGGKNSRPNHVDRAVDRPVDWGVDCPVDRGVDTGCRPC